MISKDLALETALAYGAVIRATELFNKDQTKGNATNFIGWAKKLIDLQETSGLELHYAANLKLTITLINNLGMQL